MRFRIIIFLCVLGVFLLSPGTARACSQPPFSAPERVISILTKEQTGRPLTHSEQDILNEYTEDTAHYVAIYDEAYPCPMYKRTIGRKRLSPARMEEIQEEMQFIERKWKEPDAYVTTPADSFLILE